MSDDVSLSFTKQTDLYLPCIVPGQYVLFWHFINFVKVSATLVVASDGSEPRLGSTFREGPSLGLDFLRRAQKIGAFIE